jgi:hypothetical protein
MATASVPEDAAEATAGAGAKPTREGMQLQHSKYQIESTNLTAENRARHSAAKNL